MSGIGGILNFNGIRVDSKKTKKMADAIRKRGPDGLRIWEAGPVALLHSHFWTTPEEVGEEQPISKGSLTLTADARIDNRGELFPLLKDNLLRETPSDAEFILAAYQKWGKDCPRYLIGDFAFALWDDRTKILYCARDPVGVRQLDYARIGNTFIFGSSVGSVIAALEDLPEMNLPFIADLLADRWDRWVYESAYQGIFRIPPAYYLTVNSRDIDLHRYWTFGADQRYHFNTEEEYISCFHGLFQEAVRARMRSTGPVALAVSGGLDSSSIACMVNDLIEKQIVNPQARMYTHAYTHTPYADEKVFFDTVSARCHHLPATLIPSDELWALKEFGEENQFPLDEPEYSALRIHTLTFIRSIKEDGCHVIIGGDGGDMVFTTDAYRYGLFLKDLPLKHMLSELPYFWPIAKPHKIVLPSRRVIEYGNFFTIIPKKMAIYLKNRAMRNQMPDFLLPVCDDTDSLVDLLPPSGLKTMSALSVYDSVTNGFNSAMLIALDTTAANCSTERRYPFYDRRIIDFLLSLPPYLSFRKGYSRYILRQVMSGLLPEEVRCRLSKSSVQGLILRGFHQKEKSKIQLLIDESIAVKMGLVHADHLLTAWNSFWAEGGIYTKDLAHFLCAETWLRYQERIRTNKSGS